MSNEFYFSSKCKRTYMILKKLKDEGLLKDFKLYNLEAIKKGKMYGASRDELITAAKTINSVGKLPFLKCVDIPSPLVGEQMEFWLQMYCKSRHNKVDISKKSYLDETPEERLAKLQPGKNMSRDISSGLGGDNELFFTDMPDLVSVDDAFNGKALDDKSNNMSGGFFSDCSTLDELDRLDDMTTKTMKSIDSVESASSRVTIKTLDELQSERKQADMMFEKYQKNIKLK